MKRFTVPCHFGSKVSPFSIYVGSPRRESHPLQHQANWLNKERGGSIPSQVMESLKKLRDMAEENAVPFEDLCVYALRAAKAEEEENKASSNDV